MQRPRPPFVIGGAGEKRTLRIAARFADQWNLPGGTPEVLADKIEVLHADCADVGRDPASVEVSVQARARADVQAMADEAAALAQAGAQHVIVGFRAPFDASRLEPISHVPRACSISVPARRSEPRDRRSEHSVTAEAWWRSGSCTD